MLEDRGIFLSAPYARKREVVTSTRYQWDSFGRGKTPFVILQYTMEGVGRFTLGNRTYDVPAGSAFISLVPERGRYFYPPESCDPWTFCWMNFYGEFGLALWGRLRERFGPVIHVSPRSAVAARLVALAGRIEDRSFSDQYEASAEAYAFYMSYRREAARTPQRLQADPAVVAAQICRDHFRDPISVKELAAQCNLSREHFSRIFKERQGVTPAAFLRQQRLEAAAEMLQASRLPLKEVALRTGFYSARHLMKAFTRAVGRTPRQYRGGAESTGKKR